MILNDGQVQHGSISITLSNGSVYTTDNFNLDVPSSQVVRTDPNDVPDGAVNRSGITTGTATLNYAADATPDPTLFLTFTEDGVLYALTQIGVVLTKGAEKKCNVSFYKIINPTNYAVT